MARAFGVICGALLASICFLSTVFAQTTCGLVEEFENTTVFWKQFEIAKKIVALHDKSVLPRLEPWLRCEDMRRRGNAALVFARLGDDRGFQVIKSILEDRSIKRVVFEIDNAGQPSPGRQIRVDRYYAAHLFGDLKDVRAVPILVPLLKDEEVKEIVPWALGEIGDKAAIPPLIEALGDNSLAMRAAALRALEKLERESSDRGLFFVFPTVCEGHGILQVDDLATLFFTGSVWQRNLNSTGAFLLWYRTGKAAYAQQV